MSDASKFRADEPTPASDARPASRFSLADPNAEPVVSIVTPFYNAGREFEETATSVFGQTFKQWEWIIVNDGTDDPESLAVLDAYRSGSVRVKVIDHATNLGPGAARNAGFEAAQGAYVMQLDDDDMLEPTAIEKLFWFLETHPGFAFAKGYTIGFGSESYVWANGFHVGDAFLERNHADILTMIRRSVAIEVGGYDGNNRDGLEDWEFWLACAAAGHWGGTVHEPLGWYRRRGTHTETWSNWDDGPREQAFRTKLQRQFPDLWRGGFPDPVGRADGAPRFRNEATENANRLTNPGKSILMVVPWFEVGGADQVNLDLIRGLGDLGWDTTIVSTLPSMNNWEHQFRLVTPDVFVMDRFLEMDDRPAFLEYLIRSRNPDVVLVSNSRFGYDLLPFARASHPELPMVDLTHAEEPWNDGGYPRLSNLYADYLDARITGSEHVRQWMLERGGRDNIHVWYTGVDADAFDPADRDRASLRAGMGVADKTVLVLFLGRLSEEKQPRVVIEVLDVLAKRGFDVRGVLVGAGPLRDQLRSDVRARSLSDRVVFEEDVSADRVADLMAASDAFLLPSLREGIAVTVYEAMASGLPVVATDVGGQAELVAPGTGILVSDPGGHDAVARIADEVANLIEDPNTRAAIGAAGRQRVVSEFRADEAIERFNGLLHAAIDSASMRGAGSEPAFDESDLETVLNRNRAIEEQQLYTLNEWRVRAQLDQRDVPDATGQDTTGGAAYRALTNVFGYPYRLLKRKNPSLALSARDRVRAILRPRK